MKVCELFTNVTMRELCRSDAGEIFSVIDAERGYLGRWLPFVQFTRTAADSQRYVDSVLDAAYREAVFTLRERELLIGLIGFKDTDPFARTTEIGYWLREAWQGRGIVTRAVDRLCRMAHDEMGLYSVTIKCATGNLPSNRIPQRLGFRLDHVERRAELLEDGHYVDANVYVKEL